MHWISTSAAALVIGSAVAFPVGPAAAQKAVNEGGRMQVRSDQDGRGQARGAAAAESRGAQSMRESRGGAMRSESNMERGQAQAQARTSTEIRGGARADTGPRGEASVRQRDSVTTLRTSRDVDNRRVVDRDRGFVDRDRRFVDRDRGFANRGFVDRDRRFVDRDMRSGSFATYDDRRLNRRYVRGRTFASDGTDVRYVDGTRSFAYRSYDNEPILHRTYGDRGYAYPPSYSSFGLYADADVDYGTPAYRGLYAYGGDAYLDNSLYLSADDDTYMSTYPVVNRAPLAGPACRCYP
jgi:hypothetical protein